MEFTSWKQKSLASFNSRSALSQWINAEEGLEVAKQHPSIRKVNTRGELLRSGNAYHLSHSLIWTFVRKTERKSDNIQIIPREKEAKNLGSLRRYRPDQRLKTMFIVNIDLQNVIFSSKHSSLEDSKSTTWSFRVLIPYSTVLCRPLKCYIKILLLHDCMDIRFEDVHVTLTTSCRWFHWPTSFISTLSGWILTSSSFQVPISAWDKANRDSIFAKQMRFLLCKISKGMAP